MLKSVHEKYEQITKKLIERELTISAMESCTGGLVASLITDTAGSSAIFKGSFVTYSNEAKIACGVKKEIIEKNGVYSEETAKAMAVSCRKAYQAEIGFGITGTLGNIDPANADSVPGQVFFAIDFQGEVFSFSQVQREVSGRFQGKLLAAALLGDKLLELLNQRRPDPAKG